MGHAKGHVREGFLEWLDSLGGKPPNSIDGEFEFEGKPIAVQAIIRRLWNCTDTLPSEYCDQLDIPKGSSYAQAVRGLKATFKRVENWGGARPGAGRPAKDGPTSVTVAASLPAPLTEMMRRKADVEGISQSKVVAGALEQALIDGHYPTSGERRGQPPKMVDFDTFDLERATTAYAEQLKRLGSKEAKAEAQKLRDAWRAMPLRERRLRLLFGYLYRGEGMFFDDIGRRLLATEIPGAYKGPAGFMITLEGTPPKGAMLVMTSNQPLVSEKALDESMVRFFGYDGQSIIGNDAYRAIVFNYLRPRWDTDFEEFDLQPQQLWMPIESYDEDEARLIVSVSADVVTYADQEGESHNTDADEFCNWIRQYGATPEKP